MDLLLYCRLHLMTGNENEQYISPSLLSTKVVIPSIYNVYELLYVCNVTPRGKRNRGKPLCHTLPGTNISKATRSKSEYSVNNHPFLLQLLYFPFPSVHVSIFPLHSSPCMLEPFPILKLKRLLAFQLMGESHC